MSYELLNPIEYIAIFAMTKVLTESVLLFQVFRFNHESQDYWLWGHDSDWIERRVLKSILTLWGDNE